MRKAAYAVLFLLLASAAGWLAANSRQAIEVARSSIADFLPVARNTDPIAIADRLSTDGFTLGMPAHLRIYKQENILEIWLDRGAGFELVRVYPVCKWSGKLGPKLKEGDGQSPEGFYEVSRAQLKPDSSYWRALNLGFPNAFDTQLGRTGSFLMIHGNCVSIGCYAMTDAGMDDIYRIVEAAIEAGQPSVPVHIFPFRMTQENLDRNASGPWSGFWENLAEGEALFLENRVPPQAYACDGSYRFSLPGDNAPGGCEPILAW